MHWLSMLQQLTLAMLVILDRVCLFLSAALQKQLPGTTHIVYSGTLKKWLKYAPEREGAGGRRTNERDQVGLMCACWSRLVHTTSVNGWISSTLHGAPSKCILQSVLSAPWLASKVEKCFSGSDGSVGQSDRGYANTSGGLCPIKSSLCYNPPWICQKASRQRGI